LTNQLTAHLKAIFPQALALVGEDLASPMATDFLKKWPTLQAPKVRPAACAFTMATIAAPRS
jgi:hypothetical protein